MGRHHGAMFCVFNGFGALAWLTLHINGWEADRRFRSLWTRGCNAPNQWHDPLPLLDLFIKAVDHVAPLCHDFAHAAPVLPGFKVQQADR